MKTGLLLLLTGLAAFAQMRDNRDPQLRCDNFQNFGNRQVRNCNVREQTVAAAGRLVVDSGTNGGVTIRGSLRNDVLVRSKIDAWADTDSEASLIASQVQLNIAPGQISATGPSTNNRSNWSVSFEIFLPQNTDLDLKAHNGGVHVSDVRGRMELNTQNGGLHLERIAGDVTGTTQNGGVHVELDGNAWEGRQLDLRTQNGGVHVQAPQNFSGHLQAETVNGSIHSDFPTPATTAAVQNGRFRPRTLDMNVGAGGPLIHLTTVNGGIHVGRN